MNSRPQGGNRGLFVAIAVVLIFVAAPLIYVLSIGPAAMMASKDLVDRDAVVVFYYPVIVLHDNTPLREPLEWYVEWWE